MKGKESALQFERSAGIPIDLFRRGLLDCGRLVEEEKEEDEGEEVLRTPAKIVPLQCEQYTKRCRLGLHLNNRKEMLFLGECLQFSLVHNLRTFLEKGLYLWDAH